MVHRQRRDPVARFDPEPFERLRHPPRVVRDLAPVGSGGRAVGPGGDDLALAMLALGMVDQPHHPQRPVLHRSQGHPLLPAASGIMPQKRRAGNLESRRAA
jgi:hypothetical protein